MITEGLKNTAQRFRNRMDPRIIASDFTRDPRNATEEMVQTRTKSPAVKPLGAPKKPKINKVGNVETAFFTNQSSGQQNNLRKKDSISDVAGKLLNFVSMTEVERKKHFELYRNFEKENLDEDKRRHDELVEALKKQREEKPKVEEKKPEEKKKEEAKKPEAKKEEAKKPEAKKEEAKKPEAKKEEAKKEEVRKPEPTKPAEPTKVPPKTAEPVKPVEPVKAPEVKPPTAKPAEVAAPKPPTAAVPKPSITPAISTAAKVAVGVAAITAATGVKAMIMRHEGVVPYPYKDSKGLWTIGVGHLIGDGKTLPPEYAAWANNGGAYDKKNNTTPALTPKQVQDLFEEDYKKHEDIAKRGPGFSKATPEVQGAFVDLSFNMGQWWTVFKKAGKAAENGDFETVAKELENSLWYKQVGNRAKEVVGLIRQGGNNANIENVNNIPKQSGEKIANISTQNQELKKQKTSGTTVAIDNTQTNVSTMGNQSPNQVLSSARRPDLPLHQQG
jgi:GH24 family phage-related lysozyme (muramidase)